MEEKKGIFDSFNIYFPILFMDGTVHWIRNSHHFNPSKITFLRHSILKTLFSITEHNSFKNSFLNLKQVKITYTVILYVFYGIVSINSETTEMITVSSHKHKMDYFFCYIIFTFSHLFYIFHQPFSFFFFFFWVG